MEKLSAYRQKMHGLCDKKILQSCFDELEKASYNGLGLNLFYYLFQISGVKWDSLVGFSVYIQIFYYGCFRSGNI